MDSIYPHMKTLETKNCILRPATIDDANDIFEYYSQEKVLKYLDIKRHKNINDSKNFINTFFIRAYKNNKFGHYAIVYKKNNKVIGNVGFNNISQNATTADIGLCLNPSYWGANLSSELIRAIVKFGFEEMNLNKIVAETYIDNKYPRSCIDELGFKYIKTIKKRISSKYKTCYRFELLKTDYYKI